MIIFSVPICLIGDSFEVDLPRRNMIIDPRANFPRYVRFRCRHHDNGMTVTITRERDAVSERDLPVPDCLGNRAFYTMRACEPNEMPTLFFYSYCGLFGETAPHSTKVIIITPGVNTIRKNAFRSCVSLKKCYMHDGVRRIEDGAFNWCRNLKVIRLSRTLEYIGNRAFHECASLDALLLPSSIVQIGDEAFARCTDIRILSFPPNIDIAQLGVGILKKCDTFFRITTSQLGIEISERDGPTFVRNMANVQQYLFRHITSPNNDQVHQSVLDFYRNLSPHHRTCLDPNVTAQTIQDCINRHGPFSAVPPDHDWMSPLHILTMNLHASNEAIRECWLSDLIAAFISDSRGNTPMDYAWRYHSFDLCVSMVSAICSHREAALTAAI